MRGGKSVRSRLAGYVRTGVLCKRRRCAYPRRGEPSVPCQCARQAYGQTDTFCAEHAVWETRNPRRPFAKRP